MIPDPFKVCGPRDLSHVFGESYVSELIDRGFVASDPEIAYRRLEANEGTGVTRSGTTSPAIEALRELVLKHGEAVFSSFALMIVAPHTHWPPAPIIETFDRTSRRYWIGPGQPFETAWPISFVFTAEGARPYEWAAESVWLSVSELMRAYGVIASVAAEIALSQKPMSMRSVGLSINHRFKSIGGPPLYSTMEIPDEESGLSYVVPDMFSDRDADIFAGQVGWPIAVPPELSSSERLAIAYLEGQFAKFPFEDAAGIFHELTGHARRPATSKNGLPKQSPK